MLIFCFFFFDKLKCYCKQQWQSAIIKRTIKLRTMASEFSDSSAQCDRGRTVVMFLFRMHLNFLLKAITNVMTNQMILLITKIQIPCPAFLSSCIKVVAQVICVIFLRDSKSKNINIIFVFNCCFLTCSKCTCLLIQIKRWVNSATVSSINEAEHFKINLTCYWNRL